MGKVFEFLSNWADELTKIMIALMMAGMVLDVLIGVANRFVFKFSISWTEQLARFLLIWISMLGSALALRRGAHIGVMFILTRLGRWRNPCLILNSILVIGFLFTVGYFGFRLCLSQSRQFSPVLKLSMFWPYLAVPTGCLLMIIHYLATLKHPEQLHSPELFPESPGV